MSIFFDAGPLFRRTYRGYQGNERHSIRAQASRVVAQDGSGDFENLRDAVNDLPAAGGLIYVKRGNYPITSYINLKSDVQIIGEGYCTKIYCDSDPTYFFYINGDNNVEISNLYLWGGQSYTASNGIYCTGSDNVMLRNLWIRNCNAIGILVRSGDNVTIRECKIYSAATMDYGIYLDGSGGAVVQDNSIHNCTCGLFSDDHDNLTITGNRIYACGADGIKFAANGAGPCQITNIAGNMIRDNTGYGINLLNGTIDKTLIASNVLVNNGSGWGQDNGTATVSGSNLVA